ncbi:hypothetical protein QBC36DRAFT_16862 [Triangularia setosa]|uniref:Uncharacterized protein n=1 Tax=Triangularia setosa TaxID=2587417 RepID=A0AAN6W6K5_9PEZI|nr:hypothetical protein QBC36DRAFT_16862 [Podospora setosa]
MHTVMLRTISLAFTWLGLLSPASAEDVPSTSGFLRRGGTVAIVMGDYLCIDGREILHLSNGKNSTDTKPSHPLTNTLSISLSASWT